MTLVHHPVPETDEVPDRPPAPPSRHAAPAGQPDHRRCAAPSAGPPSGGAVVVGLCGPLVAPARPTCPRRAEAFTRPAQAAPVPVLRPRAQRQGHRHPARRVAGQGVRGLRLGRADRRPARLPHRRQQAGVGGGQPGRPDPAAGVAAGLVPDRPRRPQGRRPGGHLRRSSSRRCGRPSSTPPSGRPRSPSTSATWPGCSSSAGWPTCATW